MQNTHALTESVMCRQSSLVGLESLTEESPDHQVNIVNVNFMISRDNYCRENICTWSLPVKFKKYAGDSHRSRAL